MKMRNTLFTIAAFTFSGMAAADVTITVPETVDVLVANGTKPKLEGGFFSANKTLTLPDGENQILFRYQPYFNQGNDRVILESDPIVAKFRATDTRLNFSMPKYRNHHQGEKQIQNLDWKIVNANGAQITVAQDTLIKHGMQVGRDFKQEIVDYNRQGGIAAITPTAFSASLPSTQTSAQPINADSTAEEMLYFWYNKADVDTQARFKQFLLENQ
ncbi:DUF2057 family protein [Vibrio ostreicida]|uniref:UPF0319 protein QWZ16_21230 n=1 Tax=Vibrio ostreicida TaxID=526588 RepID=A0ABT8BY89_9VIBR|nr:DUF2057 family protein [Vibrio ostreicida]MDN3612120.1 DUF2057 family protein [Vibrio ostreicida]NPD08521.1 DUF2057 family protein [Vibrio ostreicida]